MVKSHDFIDKIVRFVYNIIEKSLFVFLGMIIINSSRKGMMLCLLRQLN